MTGLQFAQSPLPAGPPDPVLAPLAGAVGVQAAVDSRITANTEGSTCPHWAIMRGNPVITSARLLPFGRSFSSGVGL